MTELDGTITYVNPAFEKVYGFTRDETIGKTPRILKSGILAQEHYEEFWNTLLSGKSIRDEFVNKTKDGRLITVGTSVNPVFSTQGAMIGFIAVQEDITESKRIEAALAHERTLLRTLIDNLPDYIYVKDTESRFILNNVAITHLLGASTPTEIVGRRDSDFFPRKLASQYYTDEQGIIRSGQPLINREETLIDAAGNRRWVLTTKVPLRDGDGKIVGIVGMNRDITERKQLEQQLLQAQKMESVGTLAGGIAHDFNNILGIILGHTTLLKEAIADSARMSKSLMAIKKAVQRGVSLVEQLLTFARKADVQFQSVRLNDVIEDLVRLVEETFPKSIKFALQFDEQIPSIVGDPNQIHQALLNLLINARDAMLVPLAPGSTIGSNGGILSIKTETLVGFKMREYFPDARGEQYVCVRVADTGIGMDEDTRNRIFEPFFSTKQLGTGTGLGLSVVYGIVKGHQGFIDVESEIGQGATFRLFFPTRRRDMEPFDTQVEVPEEVAGGKETILLVEDEEMLLDLLGTLLAGKGYRVLTSKDGIEAVDVYRRHRSEVALVLMDVGLPRLSGQEVLQKLKEMNPKVRVILASGYLDPLIKSEMLQAGAKYFVQKPYVPNEILRQVRDTLDRTEQ